MIVLLQVFFWLSLLALVHTYFLYPLLLQILATEKTNNLEIYLPTDTLPFVSILMSVYNEEALIADKIASLLALDYPPDRLQIYIGSDASSDQTNAILSQVAQAHSHLHFSPFSDRRGKPSVINDLAELARKTIDHPDQHIFLLTDASVMLSKTTLYHLVKHFKNEKITIVDAHMLHTGMKSKGISHSENTYISREVLLKHREGIVWGKMIGPFGGCYAIRSSWLAPIPPQFLVDDFYITMKVFEKQGRAISELEAICEEPVSHEIKEEYRRKARISAGNFQNLRTFPKLWWPPIRPLQFAFFSHKVLRWLGPFWLSFLFISSGFLALSNLKVYEYIWIGLLIMFLLLPLLDFLLQKIAVNVAPLRGLRYFLLMNVALLSGFFRYLGGIQQGVWNPPKRS